MKNDKGDSSLFFKFFHKPDLMLMNILKRKGFYRAFFRVEADRNTLYSANIVHGTFLVKVSQSNVPGGLFNGDGRDRGWIFWIRASFFSRYTSLEWLIMSSRVEPLSPLLFQVPIHALLYFHSLQILENSAGKRRKEAFAA